MPLLLMQDTVIKDLNTMRMCIYGMVLKLFSKLTITFLITGDLYFEWVFLYKKFRPCFIQLLFVNYFTTGNAEILNLAAPIGINSSCSTFVLTATGLDGNVSTSPY